MRTPISCLTVVAFLAGCNTPSPSPAPQPTPQAPAQNAAPASAGTSATALDPALANEKSPELFKARFLTTKGDFVLEVHSAWSPRGAARFYNLVKLGYFDGVPFFRVMQGFMAQFGIHGDPAISARWKEAVIADDPSAGHSNERGAISFATAGPNTRTTQVFINYGNNAALDGMGFTPFGKVVQGLDIVDALYNGYGDGVPAGNGPDQGRMQAEGNAYLKRDFPKLDYVKTARLEP